MNLQVAENNSTVQMRIDGHVHDQLRIAHLNQLERDAKNWNLEDGVRELIALTKETRLHDSALDQLFWVCRMSLPSGALHHYITTAMVLLLRKSVNTGHKLPQDEHDATRLILRLIHERARIEIRDLPNVICDEAVHLIDEIGNAHRKKPITGIADYQREWLRAASVQDLRKVGIRQWQKLCPISGLRPLVLKAFLTDLEVATFRLPEFFDLSAGFEHAVLYLRRVYPNQAPDSFRRFRERYSDKMRKSVNDAIAQESYSPIFA